MTLSCFGGKVAMEEMTIINTFGPEKYVHGDDRFSKDNYKNQNPKRNHKMWAMKETANLNRLVEFF